MLLMKINKKSPYEIPGIISSSENVVHNFNLNTHS
jgi:hypothetical protein